MRKGFEKIPLIAEHMQRRHSLVYVIRGILPCTLHTHAGRPRQFSLCRVHAGVFPQLGRVPFQIQQIIHHLKSNTQMKAILTPRRQCRITRLGQRQSGLQGRGKQVSSLVRMDVAYLFQGRRRTFQGDIQGLSGNHAGHTRPAGR